ncbi:hypothetical protein [Microseira wollei]|uniref:Uncharacterized protein n=1 Tax=Microseira wollei NIES-4236 TaxID=2530354 RepID=A0AAV3WPX4_9CYAN|nr:hypothetical protein [Microseira wollei]GET44199.1 hypothetical protein MiSe_90250 [Microseira wollei NIES-4236]
MSTSEFNFDKVFEQTIKDRGKTHVFFMNKVLVPDFAQQKKDVGDALRINDLPSSMKLDGTQNPSALPGMQDIFNILVSGIAADLKTGGIVTAPLTGQAVAEVIARVVAGAAIDASETLYQIYTDDLSVSNRVNQSWTGKAGD